MTAPTKRPTKKLDARERELYALIATQLGRMELKSIADEYARASGTPFPAGESIITFILVFERDRGMISVY